MAVEDLLRGQSLKDVATWADEIKRRPEYRFTSRLHYVNPEDDEPARCGYEYKRDCPNGNQCIIGALFNYTRRIENESTSVSKNSNDTTLLPKPARIEALKFLVHFVGDLHQPLHVSGRLRGGNGANIRFFGAKTNLHSLWDGKLLDKRMNDDFDRSQQRYFEYLKDQYETTFKADARDWTKCKREDALENKSGESDAISLSKLPFLLVQPLFNLLSIANNKQDRIDAQHLTSDANPKLCFNKWATEVNRLNCGVVWNGWEENVNLGQDYYERAIEVVEMEIIKGGVRLAWLLNSIL